MKKIVLQKIMLQQSELSAWFVWEMLQNIIPRDCFYFCSMERNSEFSLLRNGVEQNSKCLLLFLFHGTEFRVVFSSTEWFRMEFRKLLVFCSTVQNSKHFSPLRNSKSFLFRGTSGISPKQTNCSFYSVFRSSSCPMKSTVSLAHCVKWLLCPPKPAKAKQNLG